MSIVEEKKKTPQFSKAETELLIKIISKYKLIIEDKTTDSDAWQKKAGAWKAVANDFNSLNPLLIMRTVENIKNRYDFLKKICKKKMGQQRQNLFQTGGGPINVVTFTPAEEAVMELMAPAFKGLESRFDPDFIHPSNPLEGITLVGLSTTVTDDTASFIEVIQEPILDWGTYSPGQLRQPKSQQLRPPEQVPLLPPPTEPTVLSSPQSVPAGTPVLAPPQPVPAVTPAAVLAQASLPVSTADRRGKRKRSDGTLERISEYTEQRQKLSDAQMRWGETEHAAKMQKIELEKELLLKEEKKINLEIEILQTELKIKEKLLNNKF